MEPVVRRELRVALSRESTGPAFEILSADAELRTAAFRLANLSTRGMFLESLDETPLPPAASLHFMLRLGRDDEEVRGVAAIRWVRASGHGPQAPRGMGIEVIEFADNDERRYQEFLEACLVGLRMGDLMRPTFTAMAPTAPVREALAMLATDPTQDCVVVVSGDGTLAGLLALREVARAACAGFRPDATLGTLMDPHPVTLPADAGLGEAAEALRDSNAAQVPIVDDGIVCGLVSTRDLARFWSEFMELKTRRLARSCERAMSFIAHDLRTPISLIQAANALLISGEMSAVEFVAEGIPDMIEGSCDTMMRLIDDILDLGMIGLGAVRLERRAIDLEELLAKVHRAFLPSARSKGITLVLEPSGSLPHINADALRLEQVLNNLISNALKFTPDGGVVVLGARVAHSRIELWVSDTGPGIAREERARIFDEFSRGRAAPRHGERSTGLGLAIVKRLVDAHGGAIEVDSVEGAGATFKVSMPIDDLQ